MGGNFFKSKPTSRILKEQIDDTINYVVDSLCTEGLTFDYVKSNLMGSSGKKESSGDLDIAINEKEQKPFENYEQRFDRFDFFDKMKNKLGEDNVHFDSKMGIIISRWPIFGTNDYVQIDWIFGNTNWLKFSHYSPMTHESRFKSLFLQQVMGILAKTHVDFILFSDNKKYKRFYISDNDSRIAEVGIRMNLERGIIRTWRHIPEKKSSLHVITPEEFESTYDCPRFERLFLDCPETAIRLLFDQYTVHEDVNTFEKVVKWHKNRLPKEVFFDFKWRVVTSLQKSSSAGQLAYGIEYDEVWD